LNAAPTLIPRKQPDEARNEQSSRHVKSASSPRILTANPISRQGSHGASPTRLKHSRASSSMSTVRQRISLQALPPIMKPPPSPPESGSEDDDSEEEKDEEDEKRREEQETVAKKLMNLEKIISPEMLGFARPTPKHAARRGAQMDTGRRLDNTSDSTSSSIRGSIPSIPSPPSGSQTSSKVASSPALKSKPGSTSPVSLNGTGAPTRSPPERALASQQGSNQGSTASSFSDVDMSDASVTASALEDAIMSNIRGGGSRLSMFARSHFAGRGGQS